MFNYLVDTLKSVFGVLTPNKHPVNSQWEFFVSFSYTLGTLHWSFRGDFGVFNDLVYALKGVFGVLTPNKRPVNSPWEFFCFFSV